MSNALYLPRDIAQRRARRIADRYGVEALALVVEGLRTGEPHKSIADAVGVTQQCVSLWALDLGRPEYTYTVHADVAAIAAER